jgi:hypothetical protein
MTLSNLKEKKEAPALPAFSSSLLRQQNGRSAFA